MNNLKLNLKNILFYSCFIYYYSSLEFNLIRVNRNGEVISSDIGEYDLFDCEGEGDDRSCDVNKNSFLEYAEGLGIYVGINILATIILLFGIPTYIIYLICVGCCCKKKTNTPAKNPTKLKYDKVEIYRITTSVCTLIGIPLMFLLSTFLGNYRMTSNSEDLPYAAGGATSLIKSLEPDLAGLFVSTASTVLAPTFSSLNTTINNGVNVPLVAKAMQNINKTVPLLPNASHMIEALIEIDYIAVDKSSKSLDNLNDIVDLLVDQNNQLVNYLRTIDGDLDDIKSANHILMKSLYNGKIIVDDTSDILIELYGSDDPSDTDYTDGLVGTIESDMKDSRRSPTGLIPTTTTFQESSDSSAGSITHLISGAMNNSASSILALTNKLTPIYTSMSNLPNYTKTGKNIIKLNTTIKSILSSNGLINKFQKILPSLQTNITNYPSLKTLYQHLVSVDTLAKNINITGAISLMEILLDIFDDIPPKLQILSEELDAIRYLNVILSSFYTLTQQLISVNTTIIELPSTLDTIFEAYDTINKTASDVIADVNSMQDSIDDSNVTINGYLNTLKYHISSSKDVEDQINNSLDSYNLTYVLIQLNKTEDLMSSIDFTTILNQINNFETTLSSLSIPLELGTSFLTLQNSINNLNLLLKRVVDTTKGGKSGTKKGDYLLLQQGYCSNDESKYCSINSDCISSGICVGIGSYRCTEKGSYRCFSDSTCTSLVSSTSYCLADKTSAESLKTLLTLFSSSNTIPDTTNYITSLNNLQTSNTVDIESSSDSINDAINSINSVNITDIKLSFNKIYLQVKKYNFTVSAKQIKDTINNVKDEVQDLSLDDYIDILKPFRDDFQKFLDDFYSTISDATAVIVRLREFLFLPNGLKARLNGFTTTNLNNVIVTSGPREMIRTIADQFDLLFDFFNDTKLGFDSPDLSKKVGKDFLIFDRMGAYEVSGYGDMNKNGPVYYLLRLLNSSKTVLSTDRGLSGIFVNKAGERYPDDIYCTLDKCQEHTLDVLNTSPLNEWKDEIPDFDISLFDSITYSREELQLFIWIPTLVLWLIGCVAFFAHFSPPNKNKNNFEKYSAGCYLGCICCQLPIIMILTAIFFVLIVIIHDACDSYGSMGDNYITSYGDAFCNNVLSGNGTLTECTFNRKLPDYLNQQNISVTIDVLEVYRAIFESECNGDGPFLNIFNSLADQIVDLPKAYTHYLINQTDELTIRQPILDIALNGGGQFGIIFSEYLKDQSVTTLTCEKIANIVDEFNSNSCDLIIPPLLWMIGPWYLCAWVLCCCGLPSGCLLGREKKKNAIHPSEDESGSHPIVVEGVVNEDDDNNDNNNEEEEDNDDDIGKKGRVTKHGHGHEYDEVEAL